MQLLQATIQNFRSLRDVTVDFGLHTAFIGGNGAGKSSILKALEKFYGSSPRLDPDDHYGRDITLPVEIELTLGNLTPEEVDTFQTRVRDGRLTVTRVFDGSQGSGRYHGVVPSNPEFAPIRAIVQALQRRQAYNALRTDNPKYADLGAAANADQVTEGMRVAAALGLDLNFESAGIAVLPVVGKNNVDRPLMIVQELGIPTYPVWDCDRAEDAEANLRLLRAADPDPDHKAAPLETRVHARYAHFQENLEVSLKADIGQALYEEVLRAACEEFDAEPSRDAQKNPEIMKRALALARDKGAVSGTLEGIVRAIWLALKGIEVGAA